MNIDSNLFTFHLPRIAFFFLARSRLKKRRRQWQPTPVLLSGKSHGRRSLVGCSTWGRIESDMTELTSHSLFTFHALEKEMATHFSVLAWRIPGTAEPGGLPSMGPHRVGHDWSATAAADWRKVLNYREWTGSGPPGCCTHLG